MQGGKGFALENVHGNNKKLQELQEEPTKS